MIVKKLISLCEKQGFFKFNADSSISKLGPTGVLIRETFKNEWFYNMVINNKDLMVFLSQDFVDTYLYAKEVHLEKLPFGIAEMLKVDNDDGAEKLQLRTTVFVPPSNSMHYFHSWQRQRKMWWRKFSASPSLYTLSDVVHKEDSTQSVDIKADYPWGSQLIENITLSTLPHELLNEQQLNTKDGRRRVQAHYVTSKITMPKVLFNILCDAYEEPNFQGEPRPLLRLHRRLAPYKVSFALTSQNEELMQLASYLCKQLRTGQISCFFVAVPSKTSLDMQWKQFDQLGIPYNIILNDNTLINGIALLRNRDTTLKEQVHITDLPDYIKKIFKNY